MAIRFNLFLLIFIFSNLASAKKMSYEEIILVVQKNNLEMQTAYQNYLSTSEKEQIARSGFWPKISASASQMQTGALITQIQPLILIQPNLISIKIFFLDSQM